MHVKECVDGIRAWRSSDPIAAETDGPFFRITCGYFQHKLLQRGGGWQRSRLETRREEKKRETDGNIVCVGCYLGASRMFGQRELNNAFAPLDFLPELLIPGAWPASVIGSKRAVASV